MVLPAYEDPSHPRHRLFGPLAGLAVGALGLIALVSTFLICRFDENATIREEHIVDNGFAVMLTELNDVVATQVEWDSAVEELDHRLNLDWADFNLGSYLHVFHGFSHVFVLDARDRVIYASVGGERASLAAFGPFDQAGRGLLSQVREGEAARPPLLPRAGSNNIAVSSIQDSHVVLIGGQPFILSATLVQPDFGKVLPRSRHAPVVIAAKPLDAAALKVLADRYLLKDLAATPLDQIKLTTGHSFLRDHFGKALIVLTWTPQRPALMLLKGLAVPLLLLLIVLALVAVRVLRGSLAIASELVASEAKSKHDATHDALTRLPNRAYLFDYLGQQLPRVAGPERTMAVLCIDLDRFKEVNDTLGHPAGDALIEATGLRLLQTCADAAFVARYGGDEFVVICEQIGEAEVYELANRIGAALTEQVMTGFGHIEVGCSIGYALIDEPGVEPSEALHRADVALYRAKDAGRQKIVRFEPEMDQAMKNRRLLEAELRLAIGTDQLRMAYQPQFDRERKLVGFEALLRWHHPERGEISPSVFVPLAEETGLILALGEQVLRMAFAETAQWQSAVIAINVSAVQLRRRGFAAQVLRIAAAAGIDPRRYEMEVTETALLGDDPVTAGNIAALKRIGFLIALDDFGTGFSSLSVLQRFSVDKIKIDCSFVAALGTGREADTLIDGIIKLGRALDLSVVAEGVENERQWDHLVDAGCHLFQGYLLGRPQLAGVPSAGASASAPAIKLPVRSPRQPQVAEARRLRTSPS